jgi:hypothetical protein
MPVLGQSYRLTKPPWLASVDMAMVSYHSTQKAYRKIPFQGICAVLCCAITNLVYKIRIHTKDGCDNDVNPAEEDVMVNRTDKLTLDMCKIVRRTGATINV